MGGRDLLLGVGLSVAVLRWCNYSLDIGSLSGMNMPSQVQASLVDYNILTLFDGCYDLGQVYIPQNWAKSYKSEVMTCLYHTTGSKNKTARYPGT